MSRDALDAALAELASAHGAGALARAFARVQSETIKRRKEAKSQYGPLARAYREAITMRDEMRQAGASVADLERGMQNVIRECWPKGREDGWKYLCQSCGDYGLEMTTCPGDASCGRSKPHLAHDFGRPCWCPKGQRFKPRERAEVASGFTQAGKGSKPRYGR